MTCIQPITVFFYGKENYQGGSWYKSKWAVFFFEKEKVTLSYLFKKMKCNLFIYLSIRAHGNIYLFIHVHAEGSQDESN